MVCLNELADIKTYDCNCNSINWINSTLTERSTMIIVHNKCVISEDSKKTLFVKCSMLFEVLL